MEIPVKCDMCNFTYKASAADVFLDHVKRCHKFEGGNFYSTCKLSGCLKIFVNYAGYVSHWYKEHNPKNPSAVVRNIALLAPMSMDIDGITVLSFLDH